jgi:iron complex transport system ATP-binding protein
VTAIVETFDLAAGWHGRAVIAKIDLAIAAGERVAIVGANGSGKTTLLRVLAGLDRPLGGSIRWRGGPLPHGADRVRLLGVLFQTEVPSQLTARELVTLGLGLDGPPSVSACAHVDRALQWADLEELAERPCASLSGGEAQRVLLTRAVVAGPELLLLDEPTNHLDPARQASLLGQLDRLRDRVAVVMATHDLALAAACDRVVLLHAGRIAAIGTASDVLTPQQLMTAMGVHVRRLDDPAGGPPLFRVLPASALEKAA